MSGASDTSSRSNADAPVPPDNDQPLRLLLVDDEDRFRTSLAKRLANRGYDVDDVGDPEQAIRRVRQDRPDVVLLDRRMPKMSFRFISQWLTMNLIFVK